MAKRGRRRSGGGGRLVLLLLVLAIAGAVIGYGWFRHGWSGAGPSDKPVSVVVTSGSTLAKAARDLEKAGAITSTTRFLRYARLFGSKAPIRAGEYQVPPHASAAEILALLQTGKTQQRFVIVPEGMPSVMVRDRLLAEPLLAGAVPDIAEGSVLPDAYSFQRGEARTAVLARMQKAMANTLDALWKERKPTSVVNTKQDAVTLASIVEKETAKPSERRMVAAVYGNRLRTGMRLQADPTVIYPITRGRPLGRRIKRSELEAVNGYNTYSSAGLPRGPIANPSRASIAAVLDPAESRALYFVADGTGGHVFADTLAEHNANVQRWYAIRRARGEM